MVFWFRKCAIIKVNGKICIIDNLLDSYRYMYINISLKLDLCDKNNLQIN